MDALFQLPTLLRVHVGRCSTLRYIAVEHSKVQRLTECGCRTIAPSPVECDQQFLRRERRNVYCIIPDCQMPNTRNHATDAVCLESSNLGVGRD